MNCTETRVRSAPIRRRGRRLLAAAASVLCVLSAACGAAGAGELSVGAGLGTDRGRVDCVDSFSCDRSSGHWKLFAGYRFGETVELQAVYFDAGRFKGGGTTPLGTEFGGAFEVRGIGLTGGYRWAFAPSWSLVGAGRAGLGSHPFRLCGRDGFQRQQDQRAAAARPRPRLRDHAGACA